jgi:hypothetical protein
LQVVTVRTVNGMIDVMTWPGWAGVQGVAALIGVASVIAVVLDYRRRLRDAATPGVSFNRLEDEESGVVITMTARRGLVLHDMSVMIWHPTLGGALLPGSEPFRTEWHPGSGPIEHSFDGIPNDDAGNPIPIRVGVLGWQRSALGWRLSGYRIGLEGGAAWEEYRRWSWWEWPRWPRRRPWRWIVATPATERAIARSPWVDSAL